MKDYIWLEAPFVMCLIIYLYFYITWFFFKQRDHSKWQSKSQDKISSVKKTHKTPWPKDTRQKHKSNSTTQTKPGQAKWVNALQLCTLFGFFLTFLDSSVTDESFVDETRVRRIYKI